MSLIDDLGRAIGQLGDPKFTRVLWRSLAITLAVLVAAFFGMNWIIGALLPDTITLPWVGEVGFLDGAISGVAMVALLAASAFLMFPVASVVIGFFLEDIAGAVEEKHYPALPPADPLPWSDTLIDAAKFLLLMILANAVALVIYLVSTIFAPVIFYIVNGLLLGREYFQLVAARRLGMVQATVLRKQHFAQIWLTGIVMAVPLSIPVVNLLVPLLGVAVFTHQFHRLAAGGAGRGVSPSG
ncbi:EI24 domain-containing protein [Oceanomicrobium pacificus]|uniref:CysZ protein n=1 Tax=Oceanomicrobium pacificus TaxID=2692916 RepID=A0A6B0TI41_9RHOB|nr:EI24 domain-containing protein [Oceanomicrobium pacificus]MXU64080.1 hypothetical protein [Oceanomicrobium pacificus]